MDTRRIKARNGEGLTFTAVGLGTGPLGELFDPLDEKTSIATVEQALASGVRVFDSSPHYGNGLAESRMGAGLRRAPRDQILVSTKIGRIMDPFTKRPEARVEVRGHARLRRRISARAALRLFLRRRDALDRALSPAHRARPARHRLIHDCDVWTHGKEEAPAPFKEAMEGCYRALDKLRNGKVIKAIGFGINEADTCVKFAKPAISTSR